MCGSLKRNGILQFIYLHLRSRGLSSLVQVTVTGKVGSEFTLQSKRAVVPLTADWCTGACTIRVGSASQRAYKGINSNFTPAGMWMNYWQSFWLSFLISRLQGDYKSPWPCISLTFYGHLMVPVESSFHDFLFLSDWSIKWVWTNTLMGTSETTLLPVMPL